ncbi:MAG: RNA degradosome polyphosphate kinase, partial [Candidatus Poribacteria bacterium]|nr:RNA degradosome polyphosphate kinase [Candidatus Poribacteria bacterium]
MSETQLTRADANPSPDASAETTPTDASTEQRAAPVDLTDPSLYINRELSWLEFNARVLGEAQDAEKPLLERLKFLGIVAMNLDEFFMVRVAGVKRQIRSGTVQTGPDGLTPVELFKQMAAKCHKQIADQYNCLLNDVLPALEEKGVFIHSVKQLGRDEYQWVDDYFHRCVFPVLTPLAIDSGHPFPALRSMSLNLAVVLRNPQTPFREDYFAVVQVPQGLDRFVRL